MRHSLIAGLLIFSNLAFSENSEVCGKVFKVIGSGTIQNGQMLTIKPAVGDGPSKIEIKDFLGNIVNTVATTRKIRGINQIYLKGEHVVYYDENSAVYHLDLMTQVEKKIEGARGTFGIC